MSIDLQLCTFCLHIWPFASAPQRGFDTGFALNASDNSQEILKESAQRGNLIPEPKLMSFLFFSSQFLPLLVENQEGYELDL